jgi:hypothetical protein
MCEDRRQGSPPRSRPQPWGDEPAALGHRSQTRRLVRPPTRPTSGWATGPLRSMRSMNRIASRASPAAWGWRSPRQLAAALEVVRQRVRRRPSRSALLITLWAVDARAGVAATSTTSRSRADRAALGDVSTAIVGDVEPGVRIRPGDQDLQLGRRNPSPCAIAWSTGLAEPVEAPSAFGRSDAYGRKESRAFAPRSCHVGTPAALPQMSHSAASITERGMTPAAAGHGGADVEVSQTFTVEWIRYLLRGPSCVTGASALASHPRVRGRSRRAGDALSVCTSTTMSSWFELVASARSRDRCDGSRPGDPTCCASDGAWSRPVSHPTSIESFPVSTNGLSWNAATSRHKQIPAASIAPAFPVEPACERVSQRPRRPVAGPPPARARRCVGPAPLAQAANAASAGWAVAAETASPAPPRTAPRGLRGGGTSQTWQGCSAASRGGVVADVGGM